MGRTCTAFALLIGAVGVSGCGGPTNLTQVADDLQSDLMSMPGVTDAWVYHDESYAEGFTFNIAVDAPAATRSQLIAIADRIADTRVSLISSYTQNVEFWVTPDKPVTVRRQSQIDSAQIADDAERLRVIAADTDGRVDWFRGDDGAANQLSVSENNTASAALLDTVRRTAGDTGLTMSVLPSSPSSRTPRMSVAFPLSTEGQSSVEQFLSHVPVDIFGVGIDNDGVRAVQTMVPADPVVAERDLSTVIEASKAVATRPMWLAWYTPSAVGGVPMFGGLIEIGDCSAPTAQIRQASLRPSHDEISPLQAGLQAKADTCITPEPIQTESAPLPVQTQSPSPTTSSDDRRTSDTARPTETTAVVARPAPASTGDGTRSMPVFSPVPPPMPVRSRVVGSRPAAGVNPSGPPSDSESAGGPGGPHPSGMGPHRSTTRSARTAR